MCVLKGCRAALQAGAEEQKAVVNSSQAAVKDLQRQLDEAKRSAESARRKVRLRVMSKSRV